MNKQELRITDNLDALFEVLPPSIVTTLNQISRFNELIEVVMDLGRAPESRYASVTNAEQILRAEEVTAEDIDYALQRITVFDEDNRAGIARTLHRISGIKNRRDAVVGLTCRVGRAVYGTIGIIEDIITSGKSILLLGRPGIGKTTMLREAARVLFEAAKGLGEKFGAEDEGDAKGDGEDDDEDDGADASDGEEEAR